jgi:hypothetical protein
MVFISGGPFATPLNAELKHGGTNVIGAMYVLPRSALVIQIPQNLSV